MKLGDEDKVRILLQEEKTATDQMAEIKREEISWLKVFLLFYSAIIAWIVSRWFTSPQSPTPIEVHLLWAVVVFSYVATVMCACLFAHKRYSYFLVKERLNRLQGTLRLYEPTEWGGVELFAPEHSSTAVRTLSDWLLRTKPFSSHLTRVAYILGANFSIDCAVWLAFTYIKCPQGPSFLALWVVLNMTIVVGAYAHDWHHFTIRDAGTRGDAGGVPSAVARGARSAVRQNVKERFGESAGPSDS